MHDEQMKDWIKWILNHYKLSLTTGLWACPLSRPYFQPNPLSLSSVLWSGLFALTLFCFNCIQLWGAFFLTASPSFLITYLTKLLFELIFSVTKKKNNTKNLSSWNRTIWPTFFWNLFGSSMDLICLFGFWKQEQYLRSLAF